MNLERIGLKSIAVFLMLIVYLPVFAVDYTHEIKERKMSFAWKIDGNLLYIKLTAATKGWVGIGFNPSKKMQDADFVLGYVKNGKVYVTDAFGVRAKEHINDTLMEGVNNVTAVKGSEEGKSTTIEFAIPINSGDSADSKIDINGSTTVLLAYGKGQDNFTSLHRFRTIKKVNLSTGRAR